MGLRSRHGNRGLYGMQRNDELLSLFGTCWRVGAISLSPTSWQTFFAACRMCLSTMGILTIIYAFVTESTVLGRRIYALGR